MSDVAVEKGLSNVDDVKVGNQDKLKTFSLILIVAFIIFICLAFWKLSDLSQYVGGDAYNYIINAGKATAFFVAAFGSLVSSILIKILDCMKQK